MRYFIAFSLLSVTVGFLLLVLFANSITYNPIRYNFPYLKESFSTLPQGWAFFTRSSREAQIIIYEYKDGVLEEMNHKHSSFSNAFGLNRKTTYLFTEVHAIHEEISNDIFINSRWNFQCNKYGDIPEEAYTVESKLKIPQLKGEYIFVYQEIIPWAWSKNRCEIDMAAKVARLNII